MIICDWVDELYSVLTCNESRLLSIMIGRPNWSPDITLSDTHLLKYKHHDYPNVSTILSTFYSSSFRLFNIWFKAR